MQSHLWSTRLIYCSTAPSHHTTILLQFHSGHFFCSHYFVLIIHITLPSSKAPAGSIAHDTSYTVAFELCCKNTQSIILNLSRLRRRHNKQVFPSMECSSLALWSVRRELAAPRKLHNNQSLTNFAEKVVTDLTFSALCEFLQLFRCQPLFCFSLGWAS